MIKKICVILLCGFLLGFVAQVDILASSFAKFTIEENEKNDISTYAIEVSNNSNIAAMTVVFEYDSKALKLKTASAGSLLNDGIVSINDSDTGKIMMAYASLEPLSESGQILQMEFEKKSNLEVSKIYTNLSIDDAIDKDGSKVNVEMNQIYVGTQTNNTGQEGDEENADTPKNTSNGNQETEDDENTDVDGNNTEPNAENSTTSNEDTSYGIIIMLIGVGVLAFLAACWIKKERNKLIKK